MLFFPGIIHEFDPYADLLYREFLISHCSCHWLSSALWISSPCAVSKVVQLSFDKISRWRRLLQLSQLVWWPGLVSAWTYHRRDGVSWSVLVASADLVLSLLLPCALASGLMVTAALVYWVLRFLRFTVNIRNVCVLLAPWMASNTCIVTYLFTKELHSSRAGLIAAAFIAIVPGQSSGQTLSFLPFFFPSLILFPFPLPFTASCRLHLSFSGRFLW